MESTAVHQERRLQRKAPDGLLRRQQRSERARDDRPALERLLDDPQVVDQIPPAYAELVARDQADERRKIAVLDRLYRGAGDALVTGRRNGAASYDAVDV